MALVRIAHQLYSRPWLITADTHKSIVSQFESYLEHGGKAHTDTEAVTETQSPLTFGETMIVNIDGIIGKRLSMLETACGGYDLDQLTKTINDASANAAIRNVIFDVNSPGGTVTGVSEAASLIKELSRTKNTVAYTSTMAASAAYWLASSANYFFAAPSSQVGSVGVYRLVVDATEAYAKEGIKVEAISAGKYKLAGADFKPMTEEERAMMQEEVNSIYGEFVAAVKANRPSINQVELPLAKVYDGNKASEYGFADGTVNHLEELITLLPRLFPK